MKEPFLINPCKINPLMVIGNPKRKKKLSKKLNKIVKKLKKIKKLRKIKKLQKVKKPKIRKLKVKKLKVKKLKILRRTTMKRKRYRPVFYKARKGYRVSPKSMLLKRSRGRILNPPISRALPPMIDIIYLGLGGVASRVIPNILPLPASLKVGLPRIAVQGLASVGMMVIGNAIKQPRIGRLLMLGGLTATAITLLDAIVFRGRLAEGDYSVSAYLPEGTEVSAYLPEGTEVSAYLPEGTEVSQSEYEMVSQPEQDIVSQSEAELISELTQEEPEISQEEELV